MARKLKSVKETKNSKSKPGKTLVTLLLDRSGSMQGVRDDTIGAINAYVETLKSTPETIHFSLVLFDTAPGGRMDLQKVHVGAKIADVKPLTREDYTPRGGTPLIDAACSTIRAVEESLVGKDAKVVIAIQTDGQENQSVENDWQGLKSLIAEKQAKGWEFVFMGAGIDAYDQGRRMGIATDNTVSYGRGKAETQAVFRSMAANTASYAAGLSGMGYTVEQKLSAGDPTVTAAKKKTSALPRSVSLGKR